MSSRLSVVIISLIVLLPMLLLATGTGLENILPGNYSATHGFVEFYSGDHQYSPFEDRHKSDPAPAVLIGAGDISVCGWASADYTAALISRLLLQFPQAEIFTAGDNVQTIGEMSEYTQCFLPTWGRFLERIHPSPGNHDWYTGEGVNYFSFFGERAGESGAGYYSYDLGDWHIVSLNSNCDGGRCDVESRQAQWLREDLDQNKRTCALVYWHHPLRSSGIVPIETGSQTFWDIASDYDVDVVINGHDHHYERFTPLDKEGQVDEETGIRSFIVGTGGAWLFDLAEPLEITEARDNSTNGVILFFLYPDHYEWMFIPVSGEFYTDFGSGKCS